MTPELGVIEGYYGKAWSAAERIANVAWLSERGYGFWLYAPKADPWLRRRWKEEHPPAEAEALAELGRACEAHGVRFGIGLSPYEIWLGFDDDAREALARKLAFFDELGAVDVALLFDDMRGDLPDLAERQLEIVDWIGGRTGADRLLVCPSYYTDDPVLDRVFGRRPEGYLDDLGAGLDPAVEVFWTGEEVVSREISAGHLERVAETLRRRPFLWDNYPVNDGGRMSRYLHLRAFTGRPASIADRVAGHGINPALQPTLTRIPALTLPESYRLGEDYRYGDAFRRAAAEVLGPELGELVWEDLLLLQDVGLDQLDDEKRKLLRSRYGGREEPGPREIVRWLDGDYRIDDETVETQ